MSNRQAKRGPRTNRPEFVSRAALAAATAAIVPRHVLGSADQPSANEKLNIAGVGVGGMGKNNLAKCAGENIVALCDLDSAHAAKTFSTYPRAKTLDRIPGGQDGHELDCVRACKGGPSANSNFDFSGPLSEMVLMGNLAVRYPNRKLLWNGQKMEVTNDAEANTYVRRQYRQGWTL